MASEVFGCVVDLLAYYEMLSGCPVVVLRCWRIFVVLVVSAREEGWYNVVTMINWLLYMYDCRCRLNMV